jgi:hypothetical protein
MAPGCPAAALTARDVGSVPEAGGHRAPPALLARPVNPLVVEQFVWCRESQMRLRGAEQVLAVELGVGGDLDGVDA